MICYPSDHPVGRPCPGPRFEPISILIPDVAVALVGPSVTLPGKVLRVAGRLEHRVCLILEMST